jgi:modulator of FtsH protease HflC
MKKTPLAILGVIVVALGILAFSSLFTVNQMAQVIVLQFGEPRRVIREPGLNIKIPFVQDVEVFDKRILDLDPPVASVVLLDKKRINVDAYARYRIVDPLRFFQIVRDELGFRKSVGQILNSAVRNAVARYLLPDLLSKKREDIMSQIKDKVGEVAERFGIEVVDVRLVRTDLPEEISKNVFDRMRSEREREANKLRAEGDEMKQTITAAADREKTVILANAEKEAKILTGQGDGERNRILAEAYGQDMQFFSFLRSMEAYRTSLSGEGTTMVLSPDSDFFRFFGDLKGGERE